MALVRSHQEVRKAQGAPDTVPLCCGDEESEGLDLVELGSKRMEMVSFN